MKKSNWQRFVAAPLVAALLLTSFAPVVMAADAAAIVAQVQQGSEASGTLPGGQFAKIWLGLTPINLNENVVVKVEWDRPDPATSGVGFFVLNEQNLAAVVGGEPLRDNNIGAGSATYFQNGPSNVEGSEFLATSSNYSVSLYNDSGSDAGFKLTVTNGLVSDDSGQVTFAGGTTTEAGATGATTDTVTTTVAATTDTVTTETVTTTAATTETVTAVATPAATVAATEAATTTSTVAAVAGGPVRAEEMKGELPEQFDQHFLALEPSVRDGDITLVMTYDPQDSTELARRINFWVLDPNGFKNFQAGANASEVAIAAGSRTFDDPDTSNRREASFNATGFGPYTVIVQNNSRVPATYDLKAVGGILIDDSAQTLTAQQAGGVAAGATGATTTTTTVAATTAPAATTVTTGTTTSGVTGEPGGSYTVKQGDTLAIIARDIYGDYRLYEQLCAFNSIADCNVIEVGQVVKLPTTAQIGATTTAAAATPAATAAATTAATPAATAAVTTTVATPAATAAVTTTAPVTSTSATTTTAAAGGLSSTGTTTKTTTAGATATGTIVDAAKANGSFKVLLDALQQTGLDTALEGSGPFTVFAPTDAAFNSLLSSNGLTEDQLLQAKELADILQYHVLSGKVLAADITNGMKANTLQGKPVTFEVKDGKVYINGAQIVTTDIQAGNGVIHAIDAVILPPQQ